MDRLSKIALAAAAVWALIFLAMLGSLELARMAGIWPERENCGGTL